MDWTFPHCPLATAYELYHCVDEIQGMLPINMLQIADVDYLKQGRQNLAEFKYLMKKVGDEATRLGKAVGPGKLPSHYKSIFFLCKGAIGILCMTKQGRSRRIEALTWATAIKLILDSRRQGDNTF